MYFKKWHGNYLILMNFINLITIQKASKSSLYWIVTYPCGSLVLISIAGKHFIFFTQVKCRTWASLFVSAETTIWLREWENWNRGSPHILLYFPLLTYTFQSQPQHHFSGKYSIKNRHVDCELKQSHTCVSTDREIESQRGGETERQRGTKRHRQTHTHTHTHTHTQTILAC